MALPKVGDPPGAVGEAGLAEHLQEQVEHAGVGLLELVEQQHRERLLAHPRGEQALFSAAAVAAADQPAGAARRAKLAHVKARQAIAAAEEELRQRLGQLGLADAGRADEQERGERLPGARQPCLDRRHRIDRQLDRVRLADDPLGEDAAGPVEVEPLPVVDQHGGHAGLGGEGGVHFGGADAPGCPFAAGTGVGVGVAADQVLDEAQRPAGIGRVAAVAAVQGVDAVDGRRRDLGHRGGGAHAVGGRRGEDLAPGGGFGLDKFQGLQGVEHARLVAFDGGQLAGRALEHGEDLPPLQVRAQVAADALAVGAAGAHLEQFEEVAETEHGLRFAGFLDQLAAALLPHAEAAHAGDDARPAGTPEGPLAEVELAAPRGQCADQRGLADSRFADQQDAAAAPAAEQPRQPPQFFLASVQRQVGAALVHPCADFWEHLFSRLLALLVVDLPLPRIAQRKVHGAGVQFEPAGPQDVGEVQQRTRRSAAGQRRLAVVAQDVLVLAEDVGRFGEDRLDAEQRHVGNALPAGFGPVQVGQRKGQRLAPGDVARGRGRRLEQQVEGCPLWLLRELPPRRLDRGQAVE